MEQSSQPIEAPKVQNGTYTLHSPSGKHRTFDISTALRGPLEGRRIVSMLIGPDNTSDYKGFGFVSVGGIILWRKFMLDDFFRQTAPILWSMITEGERSPYVAKGWRLLHEGVCLYCNRKLTTPESIARGIGPECWARHH